jgi:hypothetical protein
LARIILHIGLRKTGTTSIQKFLNRNYNTLLKNNILYPKSGLPLKESVYAHHDLSVAITKIRPPTQDQCWQQLHAELSLQGNRLVFISSEIFSVATPDQIRQIRVELKDHQVSVLIYLRDPVSFMISLYKEQIKAQNESLAFGKFIRQRFNLVDYDGLIQNWKDIFGDSSVILKDYDDLLSNDLVIQNLLVSINLGNYSTDFTFLDKSNVSPEDNVVNMIRYLNLIKNNFWLPGSVKSKIQENIRDLNKGNDHGKLLLSRYSRYLPKKMVTDHEMKWLESKIHSYSNKYRNNFQNNINFVHPGSAL